MIKGGIYLVIDPAMEIDFLISQLEKALKSRKITVVQIWNHWENVQDRPGLIETICGMAHASQIPVLINESWEWLKSTSLDGVHFDTPPDDLNAIRASVGRPFLTGLTVSNDLDRVVWAAGHSFDYISFCSVFPSPSASGCELVTPETLIRARELTDLPIFVSGGISPDNLHLLPNAAYDGIAVISGIMKQPEPEVSARSYYRAMRG